MLGATAGLSSSEHRALACTPALLDKPAVAPQHSSVDSLLRWHVPWRTLMHRPTVALLAAILALGAVVMWIWPPANPEGTLASLHGAFVRMFILLGALWLAEPSLRRFPPWMILVGLTCGILLLAALRSPGLWRIALPVLVILWMTRRMGRPPKQAKA
jgi:hypothetical protein